MTRKLWVLATVTLFGVSAVLAGVGLTRNAAACDDATKTAAAKSATSSCCAKDGTSSASVDAKKVHKSMIKSAVVAPGAAPILNMAAFGGMLAGGADCPPCDWCPEMTTASMNAGSKACATQMTAAECASKMSTASAGCADKQAAVKTASHEAIPAGHPVIVNASGTGHPGCGSASAAKVASSEGCTPKNASASLASVTIAAGGEGCTRSSGSAAAAGHDGDKAAAGCCESGKTASAAGSGEKCSSTAKTASLKGKVDEMPYRENKRVTLAGSYACGHCTLNKTEDCAPMLKTADGKVYPLLKNNHSMDMRAKEGKSLEVSATVKKVDGVKFLDVKSYKVM